MLKNLQVLLRFFCFWLIFFLIDRAIFLIFFAGRSGAGTYEILASFIHGLRLDASTAVYISAIPLLVYIVLWFIPKLRLPVAVPKIYVYFIITLITALSMVNLSVYREWGSKINFKVLDFAFNAPKEALASSSSSPALMSAIIASLMIASGIWLSKKIIHYKIPARNAPIWVKTVSSLLFIGIAGLTIRGGWQLAPINPSMAYYSDKPVLNHAAVNTYWNLLRDWLKNKSVGNNPYNYFPDKEAKRITEQLYAGKKPEVVPLLKTVRPNIVLIILESFTADVIESLNGEKGIAPQFEKLADSGVLFTNIYASGDRTDKGLIAILSGFPSQAIRSIVKENNKHEKLPSIAADLKKNGYQTSFYYGGESEFSNIKSYILSHGYNRLVDQNNFPEAERNSKWGSHDHVVFKRQATDLSQEREPFFSTLLTLSNHEPFEVPGKPRYPETTLENKFRSTAFYTDSVLYDFINQAKQAAWYKNTLFIIVADHGHRLPLNKHESHDPGRYHIPLLLFGDVIKENYRGRRIDYIGSQTDIPATLLKQLNIPATHYQWSDDILNRPREFAFFDWDNGFGIVSPGQSISFDNIGKQVIYRRKENYAANDSLLTIGKAYMQSVFQHYINY